MGNFNFEIPEELHKQFKIQAINKGMGMADLLIEWIKEGIKKEVI